ncbi:MAG: tRNA uridine-5-carboxymethylaminomethyl(34) synthesis GTPase MnmE, partial [Muribaculaceae bacterium]|nr:tRNA uridine-5-carboxymethylaminomethyl(34) synthesis GTPase MnmE [Muribaculaceae bacterium]
MEQFKVKEDTIAAISTPNGTGGIAVIRISGPDALSIVDSAWKGKSLKESTTHTAHLGRYCNTSGEVLDECVATLFRAPSTFTGEDVVELSVHGSRWIQREVLSDLIRRGARVADPGEFTRRAYLNGRLDLAQAEGVADLISASSKAAHSLALSQTRGHFSKALDSLRLQLIDFASLLELELDFSEEDVEFADREKMLALSRTILKEVTRLSNSYSSGAVLKEGIPVVIAGVPNAGKSSLLNLLLNDDKAIVSDIPGTTRDIIEDTLELDGYLYRFIDTAGLRESADKVESIGIDRAKERMRTAKIVIWLY